MEQIILKNSEWLRGKDVKFSRLYVSDPKDRTGEANKCCLGVLACSLGFSLDDLDLVSAPKELFDKFCAKHQGRRSRAKRFKNIEFLVVKSGSTVYGIDNSRGSYRMMEINDDTKTRDATKVKRLNEIINEYGVNFVFEKDK